MTEKTRIKEIFNIFDSDKNGKIDPEEFMKGMRLYLNIGTIDQPSEYDSVFMDIFNLCDKQGIFKKKDGNLDFKEFTRVVEAVPNPLSSNKLLNVGITMFNILDKDHSKSISMKEFQKYADATGLSQKELNKFVKQMDNDGNGQIEMNEFVDWFVQAYTQN